MRDCVWGYHGIPCTTASSPDQEPLGAYKSDAAEALGKCVCWEFIDEQLCGCRTGQILPGRDLMMVWQFTVLGYGFCCLQVL